jgi:hypothetical protein
MKYLNKISVTLFLVVTIFFLACKKEAIVLDDPLVYTRPINLPLPLFELSMVPLDVFEDFENVDGVIIDDERLVSIEIKKALDLEWEYDINFNIQNMVNSETLDLINNFNIYFDFKNGLPFEIHNQIYAVTDNGSIIDSLLDKNQSIWLSPAINSDGSLGEYTINYIDTKFINEKIRSYYQSNVTKLKIHLQIKSQSLSSASVPDLIKLNDSFILGMKLTVDIKSDSTTK